MQELTLHLPDGIDDGRFEGRTAVRGIVCQDEKYLVICGKMGDCKFPGGGMEQGEFLFGTLMREVLEETGYYVRQDSIWEGFLVHEMAVRDMQEILVMDSYYFFCEVEGTKDALNGRNQWEAEKDTTVCWLPLPEMIARNEKVEDPSKAPWVVRELLVMKKLLKLHI